MKRYLNSLIDDCLNEVTNVINKNIIEGKSHSKELDIVKIKLKEAQMWLYEV